MDQRRTASRRVELRILGPVELHADAQPVHLTGLQRSLLVMLALGGGHVLGVPRLIEGLWELDPPTAAPARIRMLVSELRKALPGLALIATRSPGYRIEAEMLRLDSADFTTAIDQARIARSDGQLDEAAKRYAEALSAWRGPALGGAASGPFVTGHATRLEEARRDAVEERAEVDLALGRYGAAITGLAELADMAPPGDRTYYLLMLAHYRSGRVAEALAVYRSARERYRDELGLEPGPTLVELHQQMLRGEPSLQASQHSQPTAPGGEVAFEPSRPAELPPDLGDFGGRDAEVAMMRALLSNSRSPVVALHGKPGVGKTTLAVHVAHLLRSRFAGGQIYVDLAGAGPRPADPHEVLGRFLVTMGVSGQSIPQDPAARVAVYRSVLADRQLIMILDNAATSTQLRTLLPPTPSSAVIITSRTQLAAPLGVRSMPLDVLDPVAGRRLVEAIIGDDRAAAESDEIDRLVTLCGGLPLAMRVAAGRLAESPHWRIANMVERLTDERHRLDELRHGGADVRATLQLSYRALSAPAAAGLRLLGALPAGDFARWSAAALFGVPVTGADPIIDELIRAGLLDYCGRDRTGEARYRLHDLIRSFAMTLLDEEPGPVDRDEAERRLFGAWLATSTSAAYGLPCRPITVLPGAGVPRPVAGYQIGDATTWFESERAGLLAVVRRAAALNSSYAYQIASAAAKFLELQGDFDSWGAVYRSGLETAQAGGDDAAIALLRCGLATIDRYQDRYEQALDGYAQARSYFVDADDAPGVALVDASVAVVLRMTGDHDVAAKLRDGAIEAFLGAGEDVRAAQVRYSAAAAHCDRQEWAEAIGQLDHALPVLAAAGDRETECRAWGVLGLAQRHLGQFASAKQHLERSVQLAGELRLVLDGAYARAALAEWHVARGAADRAQEVFTVSMQMLRSIGDRKGEAWILTKLSRLLATQGRLDEAVVAGEDAIRISASVGGTLPAPDLHTYLAELKAKVAAQRGMPET